MFVITNAQLCKPTPIKNVLSLFDGISCGQLALRKVGIEYENYYASEIEDFSIRVTQQHFPETVQLGDVKGVQADQLPPIDLLMAGSPCQGFSIAGKGLAFKDERSKLYYEFLRLLKETQPKYFFLENVLMGAESESIITEDLGVTPYFVNSSSFSAQSRARLYWTNLPVKNLPLWRDMTVVGDILEPTTSEKIYTQPYLKLYDWKKEQAYVQRTPCGASTRRLGWVGKNEAQATRVYSKDGKSVCLLAKAGGQGGKTGLYALNGEQARKLSVLECERLQTLPEGYTTSVKGSNEKRYQAIGNGWTVDVVAHFFKGLN